MILPTVLSAARPRVERFDEVSGGEVADLQAGVIAAVPNPIRGVALPVPAGPMIARLCCARIHSRLDR